MISRTYIASFVAFLAFVAQVSHLELPYTPEEITDALVIIAAVGGFAWTIYERFKKGDIVSWWGRKEPLTGTESPEDENAS